MATPRRLSNPPITEALIELRVVGAAQLDSTAYRKFAPTIGERFPKLEEKKKTEVRFEAGQGGVSAALKELGYIGTFYKSQDEKRIAQFRNDGFALNRLGGYTTADDLFDEAIELWGHYRQLVQPHGVSRIALRFINNIDIPLKQGQDIADFLLASPPLPLLPLEPGKDETVSVSSFQVRITAHEKGTTVIVTHRLTPGDVSKYLLDIDAFQEGEIEMDTEGFRRRLQELRELKNRVFFSMVSDLALEPYDR